MPKPRTMNTPTLESIALHALKSSAGVIRNEAQVGPLGLVGDRELLAIDGESGAFITSRRHPALLGVSARRDGNRFALNHDRAGALALSIGDFAGESVETQVWSDAFAAESTTPEADAWISDVLGQSARLVYIGESSRRRPDATPDRPVVAFVDSAPLLLVGQASIESVCQRAGLPVDPRRFRANLIIGNLAAFAEEDWKHVRIGEVELRITHRCERCILTTRDPDSGNRHPGNEPLKTLLRERSNEDGQPCLGVNCVVERTGVVRVGDFVEAA